MLDIREIRYNFEKVKAALDRRGEDYELERLLELDERRREILAESEQLKHLRNEVSKKISALKSEKKDASQYINEMREVGERIKAFDEELRSVEEETRSRLLEIPNIPDPAVPTGKDDTENVEVRRWGIPREFGFTPKPHWELGTDLNILDFAAAAKITGARFVLYRGDGARLVRAMASFMIDMHVFERGYREILPPFIVNEDSMIGTGQLPKFAEDAFKLEGLDYYLIPTSEVPVTNILRDEIIAEAELPIKHCSYSACFRQEAGAGGRDTRGLIRTHQFDKVELVHFTRAEDSAASLEQMVLDASVILEKLEIPYRVVQICTGDLGISAANKYDLEVWMPSYERYVEVSSCSNCTDYQARRANIRYREEESGNLRFAHTLNGSGLAIGRTIAAFLENHQQADGTIHIPEVLRPYMGNKDKIVLE